MWPILLDMTKDDCKKTLRRLELEAYSGVVSALRAQGGLTSDKHKLLQNVAETLNISQERHRAEIRRAVNDERLITIAHCMTGDDTTDEWALEGRRLIPLMPRLMPQTAYSAIADEEANKINIENEKLPLPANTERKRPIQPIVTEPVAKSLHFRVPPEPGSKINTQNNVDELNNKKRKSSAASVNMESSSLAQHLMMGQPKVSKVQQLYRQKTKALLKAQMKNQRHSIPHFQSSNVQKGDEEVKIVSSGVSNDNQLPKSKNAVALQQQQIIGKTTVAPVQSTSGNFVQQQHSEFPLQQKSIKICPARKIGSNTRTQPQGQKVIIVSASQGVTAPSSILQRTLTIPFVKSISMKNLEKVKILNNTVITPATTTTTVTQQQTKPKLITVQTKMKPMLKHIPLIQGIQNRTTGLKMVQKQIVAQMQPKSMSASVPASSVYIMNTNAKLNAVETSEPDLLENVEHSSNKSSVLAEILKASGVLSEDVVDQTDIETQITQCTEIPGLKIASKTDAKQVVGEAEKEFEELIVDNTSNFVIIQNEEVEEQDTIFLDEPFEQNEEIVEMMSSLDPETGVVYSTVPEQEITSRTVTTTDEFEEFANAITAETTTLTENQINNETEEEEEEEIDPILLEMESIHNATSSNINMPSLSN